MSSEKEQPKQGIELLKEYFSTEKAHIEDGDLEVTANFIFDAIHNEDYETLKYIVDTAQRLQSPAILKDEKKRAMIAGMGRVAFWGAERVYLPTLNDEQLNLLREIQKGENAHALGHVIGKEVGTDAYRLALTGLIGISRMPVKGGDFYAEISPRGERMLEKNPLQEENPQS